MDIYQRIKKLELEIPELLKPVASYKPAVIYQNLVYVAGHTGVRHQKLIYQGKLGVDVSIEEGKESAKTAALNCLAAIQSVIDDLNKIERIIRVTGYVASGPGFNYQPEVIEGASSLLIAIFGDAGWHARSAIGVAELPYNAPVEVEIIASLKP
jgi:enamine deaminase RidA (YjgF/YER057c/UK114 family)